MYLGKLCDKSHAFSSLEKSGKGQNFPNPFVFFQFLENDAKKANFYLLWPHRNLY